MFVRFCNHIINVEDIKHVENYPINKGCKKYAINVTLKNDKVIHIGGFDSETASNIFRDIENACFEYNKKLEKD